MTKDVYMGKRPSVQEVLEPRFSDATGGTLTLSGNMTLASRDTREAM